MIAPATWRQCLLLAAAPLGMACETHGSARLEGRWRGVRVEGVAPESAAVANAFASSLELDVHGNTLAVSTQKERQLGRYRVVGETGTTLVITTDKDGPDQPQTFVFIDDRTMRWSPVEGKAIVLAKH